MKKLIVWAATLFVFLLTIVKTVGWVTYVKIELDHIHPFWFFLRIAIAAGSVLVLPFLLAFVTHATSIRTMDFISKKVKDWFKQPELGRTETTAIKIGDRTFFR